MSTQTSGFRPVGFSFTQPQQSFRLIELPPDLVDLIETKSNDRRPVRLQFKSSISQNSGTPNSHDPSNTLTEGHLHLCSDDKVWAVKQVSTSNSVHVTQTCPSIIRKGTSSNGDVHMDIDMDIDTYSDPNQNREITAIAQVKNVLELIPVEPDLAAIELQIRSLIPYSTDPTADDTYTISRPRPSSSNPVTLNQILQDIAAPRRSILSIATKLFLCLSDTNKSINSKSVTIPTPTRLLSAWQDFIQVCNIRGIHIDSDKATDHSIKSEKFGSIFAEMDSDAEADSISNSPTTTHIDILRAILRRFRALPPPESTATQAPDPEDLVDKAWETIPVQGDWNAEDLTLTIGQWILQAAQTQPNDTTSAVGLPAQSFIEKWSHLVSETWTSYCQIPVLVTRAKQNGVEIEISKISQTKDGAESIEEVIRITQQQNQLHHTGAGLFGVGNKSTSHGKSVLASGALTASAAKAATGSAETDSKKRKWHDKFAAMRNNKK
ncbi:hypothetical protein PV10_04843 [Exophiala mesophila]|uniref:Sister chromatid cohesion protein Dcc1 n=1 Tax=Exophiala mesophila TaxID=212818 RepID=A0A0D1ZG33_EXOME|nr:uncharacterized protein PV10_04843 [Exophiala mesophila]KIV93647.1 hypothetical protein PV10_04843 [Exophiala mesophila]